MRSTSPGRSAPAGFELGVVRGRDRAGRRRTRRLRPVPTLNGPVHVGLGGGEKRGDDVVDVDVVTGLFAVAEHLRGRPARAARRRRSRRRPPRRAGPGAGRRRCRAAARRSRGRAGGRKGRDSPRPRAWIGRTARRAGTRRPRRAAGRAPLPRHRSPRRSRRTGSASCRSRAAASRRLIVPPTFTPGRRPGRRRTCARRSAPRGGRPARGVLARTPLRRRRVGDVAFVRARRRPRARPPGSSACPEERSSRTTTSSPRATSASTRFEPMNPAPPVTRVRMRET